MNKELTDKLQKAFPLILEELYGDPKATCMAFGIECGDGWYQLLASMMSSLQWNTDKNRYPQVIATQIKEKFGSLRFYYKTRETKKSDYTMRHEGYIEGMIVLGESLSYHICEECGTNQNIVHTKGWIRSICTKCKNKLYPKDEINETSTNNY